jgi:uncharacterized membrane protein YeaQ/YmgE (transglycosylase-associated protein family)
MKLSKAGGVRFRRFAAGFAVVFAMAPGAAAQTMFDGQDPVSSAPSRPFRVSFDKGATAPSIQSNLSRLSQPSHADASTIQFKPPRRRYAATPSSSTKSAQKLTAAVALGVVGGFAGGLLGGVLTHWDQSRGMNGFVIGAPIGAMVGAFAGYRLVK